MLWGPFCAWDCSTSALWLPVQKFSPAQGHVARFLRNHENQCYRRRLSPHACFHFKQQLSADSAARFWAQGRWALLSSDHSPKWLEPHSLQSDRSCSSPDLSHWLFSLKRSEPGRGKEGVKARNQIKSLHATQSISRGILGGINVFPSVSHYWQQKIWKVPS